MTIFTVRNSQTFFRKSVTLAKLYKRQKETRAWALVVRRLFGHYGNLQSNFCAGHLVLTELQASYFSP